MPCIRKVCEWSIKTKRSVESFEIKSTYRDNITGNCYGIISSEQSIILVWYLILWTFTYSFLYFSPPLKFYCVYFQCVHSRLPKSKNHPDVDLIIPCTLIVYAASIITRVGVSTQSLSLLTLPKNFTPFYR